MHTSKQQNNHPYLTNPQTPHRIQKQLISSDVLQAYKQLHRNIDEVHIKVQHVISKHQAEFLLAYRSHIVKIQKQLGDIKNKSEQQQKMFSSNDRIKFLQKQIAVFRQQALIVYQKLQKTEKQLELFKKKYEEALMSLQQSEKSAKQYKKSSKLTEATKIANQMKIKQLQQALKQKQQEIQRLKQRKQYEQNNLTSLNLNSIRSDHGRTRYERASSSFAESTARKSIRLGDSSVFQDKMFKDFFFQCIKKVKKQIGLRKNAQKIDLSKINNIDQFRQIDKIKIIELFFSNQKLESWLYQKLFPNSLFEKLQAVTKPKPDVNANMQGTTATTGFLLPRVKQKQRKTLSKFDIKI